MMRSVYILAGGITKLREGGLLAVHISNRYFDLRPVLARISDELHLLPMYAGRMPSLRRGAGHDLFSMRDYQPQDDLRHIDWKATARSRRLTVREFTSEDERRITIVLDTHLPRVANVVEWVLVQYDEVRHFAGFD